MFSISPTVEAKCARLADRPVADRWAASASIWSRFFVLGGQRWTRWTEIADVMPRALSFAMLRSVGLEIPEGAQEILAVLNSFDIEDDGSAEWDHTVDLIALMVPVIGGCDADTCLKKALRTYLESAFCRIWTDYAVETGRPVSLAEVNERIPDEAEWQTALALVNALLGSRI